MTSPVGLLDFFILEASDSIDRLDASVSGAATRPPDIQTLLRHSRTLRGSSTMARQNGIAEVAAGIERLARALRDGEVQWTQALHAALVAAVDDLKLLLRSVRNWSTADERRAQSRTAELARLAPEAPRRTPTPSTGGGDAFLVAETGDIADALEQVGRAPQPAAASAAPARGRAVTPTGRELKEFLDRGIETLGQLEDRPLRDAAPLPDEVIVPIQDLLYRGRGAVERARALRDELRQRGGTPPQDAIDELYDLLDLALVD